MREIKMRLLPLAAAMVLGLSSCATVPPPAPERDATRLLIVHPEFRAAAQVAPHWVGEALGTITRYEEELARAGR